MTTLHDLPADEVWTVEHIRQRQAEVAAAGLKWTVVESLKVSETIKMRGKGWQKDVGQRASGGAHCAAGGDCEGNCVPAER